MFTNQRGLIVLAVVAAGWGLAACNQTADYGASRLALSPQARYAAEEAERASLNHYRWPHPDRAVGFKKGDAKLHIKQRPLQAQPASRDASSATDLGAVY